jgi:hypothetical protein
MLGWPARRRSVRAGDRTRLTPNFCFWLGVSAAGLRRSEQPAMVTMWPAACRSACSLAGVQQSVWDCHGSGPQFPGVGVPACARHREGCAPRACPGAGPGPDRSSCRHGAAEVCPGLERRSRPVGGFLSEASRPEHVNDLAAGPHAPDDLRRPRLVRFFPGWSLGSLARCGWA